MNVARILYPVRVLGPGNRIGIWLCGCNRKCPGCSNPELWKPQKKYEIQVDHLLELINQVWSANRIDGFTISGGEPFLQSEELSSFIERIHHISCDILVYTGFTLQELRQKKDPFVERIISSISVLVDGPYLQDQNENVFLRGSKNQCVYILNEKYRMKYDNYLENGKNEIQNFISKDGVISVGIHRKDF